KLQKRAIEKGGKPFDGVATLGGGRRYSRSIQEAPGCGLLRRWGIGCHILLDRVGAAGAVGCGSGDGAALVYDPWLALGDPAGAGGRSHPWDGSASGMGAGGRFGGHLGGYQAHGSRAQGQGLSAVRVEWFQRPP